MERSTENHSTESSDCALNSCFCGLAQRCAVALQSRRRPFKRKPFSVQKLVARSLARTESFAFHLGLYYCSMFAKVS